MYINRDKRYFLSLLLNTIFVSKQLGVCLFLCIVFHSHSHSKVIIVPTSSSAEPVICSLHCEHSNEEHTEHQIDISQTDLPEQEQLFSGLAAAFASVYSPYLFCEADPAGYFAENFILPSVSPPLLNMVMRC